MRSWKMRILLLMALLLTGFARAEEVLCVSAQDCAALITAAGEEIVSPGTWTDAFCVLEGQRWALGREEGGATRYALCDASGTLLTQPLYEMFQAAGGVILFRQDGLFGAMTLDGEALLPARYTQLTTEDGVHFLATDSDPYDDDADEILLVFAAGETLTTDTFTDQGLRNLSDGRMVYHDPLTECYGYLDGRGDVAVSARYLTAESFENGLARASLDSGLGVVGTDGAWRIEPRFSFLERGDGVFVGLIGREICVVYDERTCEERFRVEGTNLSVAVVGACTLVLEDGAILVYDRTGAVLLQTDGAATLTAGLDGQMILSDGDWGAKCVSLVTADGAVLERKDQHLLPLASQRYAFYTMDVAVYYSDLLGEMRYSCDYDSLRCGMMDASGREILPARYAQITALGLDRFLAAAKDGLRVFDADGNLIWSKVDSEE